MIIDRCAGYITIVLEQEDFRNLPWRKIIDEIKIIPTAQYDGDEKKWYIEDTLQNEERVNELTDRFLKDEDQLTMF